MTQAKHTPLPWRVEPDTSLIWSVDDDNGSMRLPLVKGKEPSHWQKGSPDMDERFANAAFIVRAANSHYELLEALKASLKKMEDDAETIDSEYNRGYSVKDMEERGILPEAIKMARAAISKAEGGAV